MTDNANCQTDNEEPINRTALAGCLPAAPAAQAGPLSVFNFALHRR